MCKRISIDMEWDDEHPHDAEPIFYFDKDGEARIDPRFQDALQNYVSDDWGFFGQVTISVTDIPRGGENG